MTKAVASMLSFSVKGATHHLHHLRHANYPRFDVFPTQLRSPVSLASFFNARHPLAGLPPSVNGYLDPSISTAKLALGCALAFSPCLALLRRRKLTSARAAPCQKASTVSRADGGD